MSYISLYRKWRPQSFEELIGQKHITKTLTSAIKEGRLSHAYLFTGPRGTGKTSTAKIIAKAINCEQGPTPTPCQSCQNCLEITRGNSMDVLEIDAASNRGIDEIRELRERLLFAPANSRKKVYIIDEVHMLTAEAFNALLKTLEEPPEHVLFVLATTEPSKVPTTVLSRCQRFDFRPITLLDLKEHLKKVAVKEGIKAEEEALKTIAQKAQGSLRDALSILDQLASFTEKKISLNEVNTLLGAPHRESLISFVYLLNEADVGKIFSFVNQLISEGRDLYQFLQETLGHLRNLFLLQQIEDNDTAEEILSLPKEDLFQLREQANLLSLLKIREFIEKLSELHPQMRGNPDAQLLLEVTLLKLVKAEIPLSSRVSPPVEIPSGAATPVKSKTSAVPQHRNTAAPKVLDLAKIKRLWPVILKQVREKKISTYALLLECQPIEVRSKEVTLSFKEGAVFHKNKMEKEENYLLLKRIIKDILEKDLDISFVLRGVDEEEALKREAKEEAEEIKEEVPPEIVNLIQKNFGAEIVKEEGS